MQNITTVIFDVDGTLLDTFNNCLALEKAYRARYPDRDAPHELFVKSHAYPRNVTYTKLGIPETEWGDFWCLVKTYIGSYEKTQVLFSGVAEILNKIKTTGYRLGINTSRDDIRLSFAWKLNSRVFSAFDKSLCVTSSKIENPKPAPDSLLWICESNGLKKKEVLYIGDSEVDMECAKNAGITFAWAAWGWRSIPFKFSRNDIVLSKPGQVLDLLES